MTPHNEAKKEDIAKIVVMPGDPLRAKYIAETFLEDARLVNQIRNMFAYTGKYKGKEVTVMAHGMGMPSVGIYAYELYKFYDVDCIIRIGSCGSFEEDIKLFDTILVDKSYTEGNFALSANNDNCHLIESSKDINKIIEEVAKENSINYIKGDILCNEFFDPYIENLEEALDRIFKKCKVIGSEMESFALFYLAKMLNKKAACLLTVVDTINDKRQVSPEERQNSLNDMITLALESTLKID